MKEIEELREELNDKFEDGSLSEGLLSLSREMDKLIVDYIKEQKQ